jgi:hypothetical protein
LEVKVTQAIVPKELLTATLGGLSLLVVSGGADGHVLTQQADGTYAPEAPSAGIGGSVGSTDNRLVRSDGTGGSTVQSTGITVDDSNNVSGVGTLSIADTTYNSPGLRFSSSNSGFGCWQSNSEIFGTIGGTVFARFQAAKSVFVAVTIGLGFNAEFQNEASGVVALVSGTAGQYRDLKLRNLTLSGAHNLAPITKAALLLLTPTAASAGRWRVTDATPANREAYPDGTDWRYTSDDTVVT